MLPLYDDGKLADDGDCCSRARGGCWAAVVSDEDDGVVAGRCFGGGDVVLVVLGGGSGGCCAFINISLSICLLLKYSVVDVSVFVCVVCVTVGCTENPPAVVCTNEFFGVLNVGGVSRFV